MPVNIDAFEHPGDFADIYGLRFVCTCAACPEQYDVKKDGRQIGYVRLRFGGLRAEYPDCGGEMIITHNIDDCSGWFDSASQRHHWLHTIALALLAKDAVRRESSQ